MVVPTPSCSPPNTAMAPVSVHKVLLSTRFQRVFGTPCRQVSLLLLSAVLLVFQCQAATALAVPISATFLPPPHPAPAIPWVGGCSLLPCPKWRLPAAFFLLNVWRCPLVAAGSRFPCAMAAFAPSIPRSPPIRGIYFCSPMTVWFLALIGRREVVPWRRFILLISMAQVM